MKKPVLIKLRYLFLALAVAMLGVVLSLMTAKKENNPYRAQQEEAARRMAEATSYLTMRFNERGIEMERDDYNKTGLIGPEFTELTTTPGEPEVKRAALNPNFAALMIKWFHEAGLKKGDTIALGTSGSFPGFIIATLTAADVYGLNVRTIASLGASMHGATRPEYTVFDIMKDLEEGGFTHQEVIGVSRGGDNEIGGSILEEILFFDTPQLCMDLCLATGYPFINIYDIAENIEYKFNLYGDNIKMFINIGGATANVGKSAYTLTFPNGLVLDPPSVPTTNLRGLMFEFSVRGIPVINLLNVKGLCTEYGIAFDPVPMQAPGEGDVYLSLQYNKLVIAVTIVLVIAILTYGRMKEIKKKPVIIR